MTQEKPVHPIARCMIEAGMTPPDALPASKEAEAAIEAMTEVAIDGPGYVSFYPSIHDCERLLAASRSAHPPTDAAIPAGGGVPTGMVLGLQAAIRAAKLAIFVINKQGVMPNSSWKSGFDRDLATAEAALSTASTAGKG